MAYILSSFVKRVLHGTRTELESSRFRRHAITVGVYGDCFFLLNDEKTSNDAKRLFFYKGSSPKRFARKFYDVMTAHARFGIMRVRRVSVGHRAFAECFLPCIRSLVFDSKRTSLYMYITDDVSHPGISPLNAFLHQNLELRAISISPILSRGFES